METPIWFFPATSEVVFFLVENKDVVVIQMIAVVLKGTSKRLSEKIDQLGSAWAIDESARATDEPDSQSFSRELDVRKPRLK